MGSTGGNILLVCALTIPFAWFALRMRVLTRGGGLMAGFIAVCVVASQGWIWLMPLFLFLISGVPGFFPDSIEEWLTRVPGLG